MADNARVTTENYWRFDLRQIPRDSKCRHQLPATAGAVFLVLMTASFAEDRVGIENGVSIAGRDIGHPMQKLFHNDDIA
ncbi:MAG: hypothetical protein P4L91_05235 [Burkholderiaceae bacterium]|nr:hypothetical protein [Burkholderiaceae bacterium]